MNQTNYPSLNDAVDGFVFDKQPASPTDIDRKALEVSCIDLIAKLENLVAKAKELPHDDFVDDSANIGRSMLDHLIGFGQKYLDGSALEQAADEIGKAVTVSHAFDEVLKTRSLKDSILRTFWNIAEKPEIQTSHAQLGESLIRSCAATFYHAIILAGFETELGQQIDQSTVVFVKELKQSWK